MFRYAALALTLCTIVACSSLEEREETDDSGYRSVYTVDPETGLKQGTFTQYDPEGNLFVVENYEADQLEGERIMYNPNGTVAVRENYTAGVFDGPYESYDTDGNVRLSGRYRDGKMNDELTGYYPSGSVREVVSFKDNTEQGPFREWYENGRPKASGTYLDGDNEHGTLHLYTEAGELERVMNCDRGRCQTFWTPDSTGVAPEAPDMTLPPARAPGPSK